MTWQSVIDLCHAGKHHPAIAPRPDALPGLPDSREQWLGWDGWVNPNRPAREERAPR